MKGRILGLIIVLLIPSSSVFAQTENFQQQRPMQGGNRSNDQGGFQQRRDMGQGQPFNQQGMMSDRNRMNMEGQPFNPQGMGRDPNMQNDRVSPREAMIMQLKEEDPDTFEDYQQIKRLERDARQLAQEYFNESNEAKKNKIQGELREKISDALMMKFELTERKTEELSRQIEQIKTKNSDRKMHVDEIVSEYMDRIIQEEMRRL